MRISLPTCKGPCSPSHPTQQSAVDAYGMSQQGYHSSGMNDLRDLIAPTANDCEKKTFGTDTPLSGTARRPPHLPSPRHVATANRGSTTHVPKNVLTLELRCLPSSFPPPAPPACAVKHVARRRRNRRRNASAECRFTRHDRPPAAAARLFFVAGEGGDVDARDPGARRRDRGGRFHLHRRRDALCAQEHPGLIWRGVFLTAVG